MFQHAYSQNKIIIWLFYFVFIQYFCYWIMMILKGKKCWNLFIYIWDCLK